MQLEDQRAAVRDSKRPQDERRTILAPERLADIRRAHEDVAPKWKRVVEKPAAIIEIGNAGHDNLVGVRTLRHELSLVTVARHAEHGVLIAQAGYCRSGQPPREPPVS